MTSARTATLGVIVPNFNYARYLPERLATIAAQTRAPDALVFLDDASADDSWQVAQPLLDALPFAVQRHRNAHRVGSVLAQWQDGLGRLDTAYVWIAEADDRARPDLMRVLAARLDADPDAAFAFCDSAPIDAAGASLGADSKAYYRIGPEALLTADAVFDTSDFLARCLCPRNMVVNASAVLWRADALRAALAATAAEFGHWLCAGDWRVYAAACTGPGHVLYVAEPLNEHRRHPGSVTGAARAVRHYGEVVLMHTVLRRELGADAGRDVLMRGHLGDLRRAWKLP